MNDHSRHRPSPAFVAFGSNRGRAVAAIEGAIHRLAAHSGIRLLAVSSLYRTAPVGGPSQRDFYNGVVKLHVALSPAALLAATRSIEIALGRKRRVRWGPRTIDLDILAMGKERIRSRGLTLPHPRYHRRRFVLVPFSEIASGFIHPVLRRTNRVLLRGLTVPDQRVTIIARWKRTRFYRFNARKKIKKSS